jgi:hypothetical protein
VDLDGRWHRSHGEERRRRSIEDERVGACVALRRALAHGPGNGGSGAGCGIN